MESSLKWRYLLIRAPCAVAYLAHSIFRDMRTEKMSLQLSVPSKFREWNDYVITYLWKLASLILLSAGAYSLPNSHWNSLNSPNMTLGSPAARLTIWSLEAETAAMATARTMKIFMINCRFTDDG